MTDVAPESRVLNVAVLPSATEFKPGQKAKVRMQAYGDEVFEGTVDKMALKNTEERLTNTKYFEVEILLKTDGRRIPSGLNGDAEIETTRLENVLKVPSQAVVGRQVETLPPDVRYKPEVDQKKTIASVVYRMVNGKAVVTPVTVGPSDVTHTVIKSGLSEGDQVISGPYKMLEQIQHDWRVKDEAKQSGSTTQPSPATQPANK